MLSVPEIRFLTLLLMNDDFPSVIPIEQVKTILCRVL